MIRWTIRILLFVVALTLLGMLPSPKSPTNARGPYESALANVGVATAWAKKPNNCNSFCEFASPGYVCLHEGFNEKCVFSGGCTTVACP